MKKIIFLALFSCQPKNQNSPSDSFNNEVLNAAIPTIKFQEEENKVFSTPNYDEDFEISITLITSNGLFGDLNSLKDKVICTNCTIKSLSSAESTMSETKYEIILTANPGVFNLFIKNNTLPYQNEKFYPQDLSSNYQFITTGGVTPSDESLPEPIAELDEEDYS